MGWLIGLLVPRFGAKLAPIIAWAAAAILAGLLLFGGWELLKHSIISHHDTGQALKVERTTGAANSVEADERTNDQTRLAQESHQTQEAINEARRQGRDPRAAYYECVRLQQSARAAGHPPPACV